MPKGSGTGPGILAMNPFAGGMVDNARVVFNFLRQFPDIIPLAGWDSVARVDEVLDFYEAESQVTADDLALMEQYRQELGKLFCHRCEYCQPCPQGVNITPVMLYGVVAHRMGPTKAAGFAEKIMESVKLCIECGECAERCPYHLPIPETLKKHLALYEEHRDAARQSSE